MRRAWATDSGKVGLLAAIVLVAAALLVRADEPAPVSRIAGAFQPVAPGVDYRHEQRQDGPLAIHVLRVDRSGHRWDLHAGLGQGTVFGLEPLGGIVARTAATVKRPAVAAINGDFFVIKAGPYQGDPRGVQIAHGELVSRPAGNSFWVAPGGELRIGPVTSKLRVAWPDKTATPIGLNEARGDDAVVLYTPTLGIPRGQTPQPPPGTRTGEKRS